jgi:hypothetical protein
MTEDLVLMERLESRENKGPIKVTACANLGTILCITVGVDIAAAIEWLAAHDSGIDVTRAVCGSCSIQ